MISEIKQAASAIGITTVITNSNERIESQLNRLTGIEDLPILLISWDIDTDLDFDANGFLKNPSSKIVCLLLDKAEDTSKVEAEKTAELMGKAFQKFIVNLNSILSRYRKGEQVNSLSGIGYKLVPIHGAAKHSGIMGRFTMLGKIENC